MNVKEILNRQPPALLYHYTTQQGFLGIITNKEIWASHTQYLNDAREFRHAIDIVIEELLKMKLDPAHQDNANLLGEMEQGLQLGIESINVCVSSFSGDGDVLSQWMAYGGGASGFSIGFSGKFLRSIIDQLNFWLVPVIYDESDQRALIRTLLQDVLAENMQRRLRPIDEYELGLPPGGNLIAYLNRYAPILKHKSFVKENEWRIISRPLPCTREGFAYRIGSSMLVPYFRIPLFSAQQPFAVEEVIVGPTPHPVQSINSVRGLLIKHGLNQVKIRNSDTPYRNW